MSITRNNIRPVTADDQATPEDSTILCDGTFTETLPKFAPDKLMLNIKNIGSGVITIAGNGNLIDGASTQQLTVQWQSFTLQYSRDKSAWFIL